jgi:hypothetical protein
MARVSKSSHEFQRDLSQRYVEQSVRLHRHCAHAGRQVKHSGDGMFAVIDTGKARAHSSGWAMQRQLAAEGWGAIEEL